MRDSCELWQDNGQMPQHRMRSLALCLDELQVYSVVPCTFFKKNCLNLYIYIYISETFAISDSDIISKCYIWSGFTLENYYCK